MPHWFNCRLPALLVAATLTAAHSTGVGADQNPAGVAGPQAVVEFNRDVRPILADHCYACHGPDKNKRKADLRLDTREGLLGSDGVQGMVVPGRLDQSELWKRVALATDKSKMPPTKLGKDLSKQDLDVLRRWIEGGAPWEGHWSYTPIRRPRPKLARSAANADRWINDIDGFVLAALADRGLEPAPPADRATLARRLHFDLLGLPPAPEIVEAFVRDVQPDAYERLVDRLLASPHFGERMAVWWLDLVRYADSVGYHGDQPVSVFPYREYVIASFNSNKRFDRFTLEQLGGDLLANPTLEDKIAAGYNRLGMMSAEGGVQPKEYLAKYMAERVRNVGGAWLGATLGCCECHDHKFDPLPTRDFYAMAAIFADITEQGLYSGSDLSGKWGTTIQVPTPSQRSALEKLQRQIAKSSAVLTQSTPRLVAEQAAWEKRQTLDVARWTALTPTRVVSRAKAKFKRMPDGSLLLQGRGADKDVYTLTFKDPPAGITALRIDVLADDSLPSRGPGRAANGNFVLTDFAATLTAENAPTADPATPAGKKQRHVQTIPIGLQNGTATFEQVDAPNPANPSGRFAAASAIGNGFRRGWAIAEQTGRAHHAVFETAANTPALSNATLTVVLKQEFDNPRHTIGRFKISVATSPRPIRAGQLPPDIAAVLSIASEQRSPAQREQLATYYRGIAPSLEAERRRQAELEAERARLDAAIPFTLTTVATTPRVVRVLPRGNWMDESKPPIEPGVPTILPQPKGAPGKRFDRTDLARWLTSRDNPLTARVLANRLWKLYFGAGLSRKLDDLGAQGEWPSHPELLDWLAGQLIDSGWDIKRTVALIVKSGTYRQSSIASPGLRELDPYNRWLARQGRFRLDAEFVRDSALSISGLLVDSIGGPSVKPYQPPGYWAYLNFPVREWQNAAGVDLYRRGLYTHWQRQYLHPALLAFDAPSREECTAERSRSNTPLQSLVLLNDTEYVEAARAFAALLIQRAGPLPADRLTEAFRRALSRRPTADETAVLMELVDKHQRHFREHPADVQALLTVGQFQAPPGIDRTDWAVWTSVARTILNLHETITRN